MKYLFFSRDLGSNKIGEYLEIDTDSYERLTSL